MTSFSARCFLAGLVVLALLVCCKFLMRSPPGEVTPLEATFHVLYINLDADVDRREKYLEDMRRMYPSRLSMERVAGVQHSSGLEGCRLAHLKALKRALDFDAEYVLVTEDDVTASDSPQALERCLTEFVARVRTLGSRRRPALLLLECGQDLEQRIRLHQCRGGPNFRRVLFGGNNTGAYLVRRDFIPRLQAVWGLARGIHIDASWQLLWPFYDVWMAFPPPLKQRRVWSHNLKGVREECKKFDTDLYFETNRFL
jgi:hypothetical protein